ncbi:hypothetical protein CVT24_000632 [Panaeolus cyanescens]|uniref:Uncharacterized protein n=1 Tax=Panaeolus cyanescens TaxID=181874 RepID=A0A409WBH0_9AGAR|nr:hypothetical protein CVT24_000632 [Panaeolus cyanescens]
MPPHSDPVAAPSPFDSDPSARAYIHLAYQLLSEAEFKRFKQLMHDMRIRGTDLHEDLTRIINITYKHRDLVEGYAALLPRGFDIEHQHSATATAEWYLIRVYTPEGALFEYPFRDSLRA